MKTKAILLIFTGMLLTLISCINYNDTDECDYTNCNTVYPSQGILTVKVSDYTNGIPIEIYSGHFDTGVLLTHDTIFSEEKDYLMAPEQYYTVIAEYVSNGDTIKAIDGGRIKVNSNNECDSVCYSVTDLTLNVKLKY